MNSFDRVVRGLVLLVVAGVSAVWTGPAQAAKLYAVLPHDDAIAVIDTDSRSVVATIAFDGVPYRLAVDRTGRVGYAAVSVRGADGSYSYHISVVDLVGNAVLRSWPVEATSTAPSIALSPDGTRLYLLQTGNSGLLQFDTSDGHITRTVPLSDITDLAATDLLVDGAGHDIYALLGKILVVLDADTGTVSRVRDLNVDLPADVFDDVQRGSMALDAQNHMLYIPLLADLFGFIPHQLDVLTAVDAAGSTPSRSMSLGDKIESVAVDPVRGKVFAATCGPLRILDATSLEVSAAVDIGEFCSSSVAFDASSNEVFVANEDIDGSNPRITVVDPVNASISATIQLPSAVSYRLVVAPTPAPSGTTTPIAAPTLRGWGLVLLALGLVVVAVGAFPRRRRNIRS